jgi:hypothetical protein
MGVIHFGSSGGGGGAAASDDTGDADAGRFANGTGTETFGCRTFTYTNHAAAPAAARRNTEKSAAPTPERRCS